jgi:ribosome-interacting GTPase 1
MNSGKLSRGDYAMYIAMFKLEDYLYKNINYILECTKIYNKKYAIKSDSAEDIKSNTRRNLRLRKYLFISLPEKRVSSLYNGIYRNTVL